MKYFFTFFLSFIIGFTAVAQAQQAPYLQYKTIPSVRLLLTDSTGWELKAKLDKKKPLMLVIFSPECDHCRHETEELKKNIEKFKNVQIVMAAMQPVHKIKEFVAEYGLDKYKNITVGRDYAYILPVYYDMKSLPFHAFYTRDRKLISGFEGTMSVAKMLAQLKSK